MIHNENLDFPFAMSDMITRFAIVSLDSLLNRLIGSSGCSVPRPPSHFLSSLYVRVWNGYTYTGKTFARVSGLIAKEKYSDQEEGETRHAARDPVA